MGFGATAKIPVKPDLAVLGSVASIEAPAKSQKEGSPFYNVELGLKPLKPTGREASFWLNFIPQFFTGNFDLQPFADAEPKTPASSIYYTYKNNIYQPGGIDKKTGKARSDRGALRILAGDEAWAALGETFGGFTVDNPPSVDSIGQALAAALKGRQVGYVLVQQKDEDGELQERYSVDYFFPATRDAVDEITKSARSPKRKRKLVLTWEAPAA